MKLAVLFDNFGPYHLARLSAAGEVAEVLGIETSRVSDEYAWETSDQADSFRRCTLHTLGGSSQLSTSELTERLEQELSDFAPNVVAVPGWSGRQGFAALRWCRSRGVPVVVMSESSTGDFARDPVREWVKRRYVRMCHAALVGGQRHLEYLAGLGMPAERIFYGYDVVDNEHFARAADVARRDAERLRLEHQLPTHYFLASARFIEKKNLDTLLRAFAAYRGRNSAPPNPQPRAPSSQPWHLVLLGDGPLRDELEQLRDELGLSDCVHLPGFKQYDELPAYYGLAGAFVHASTTEQWGLVVNEAAAAGLPLLVSERCGSVPELVHEGRNGYRFDPADTTALAAGLERLARMDWEQREAMAEAGREIVAEFGPERFASGLCRAAEVAIEVAAAGVRSRPTDRLLLRALLWGAG